MSGGLQLLPTEIFERLELVLKKLNISDYTVNLETLSDSIVHYASLIVRARVQNEEVHCFIIKCNLVEQPLVDLNKFFQREIYCYVNILPELHKFQLEKNLEEVVVFYPRCLDSNDEFNKEFLILEDMTSRGYVGKSQFQMLDYDHISVTLKEYARLHALGFAMRDQKKIVFDQLAMNVFEIVFTDCSEEARRLMSNAYKRALKCFDYENEPVLFSALGNLFIDVPNIIFEIFGKQLDSEHSVFTHVDCRVGNLLFRYNQKGDVIKTCFLDWQGLTLASPVIDMLYVIFMNTNRDLRKKHLDELIRDYYANFCSFLRGLGSDPNRLYPFETLMEHVKVYGVHSLLLATVTLNIMFDPSDNSHEGENTFENRIKGIVMDCYNLGSLRVDM